MLLELWITQLFPISSLCNLILCTCRAQFIHMSSAEHYSLISLYIFFSLSLHRLLILTALKLKFFTCIISHLKIQGSTPVWQAILLGSRTTQPGWQFYQVRCIMTETGLNILLYPYQHANKREADLDPVTWATFLSGPHLNIDIQLQKWTRMGLDIGTASQEYHEHNRMAYFSSNKECQNNPGTGWKGQDWEWWDASFYCKIGRSSNQRQQHKTT